MFLPQVEQAVTDLSKFQAMVKLVAFSPFKSGTNALDNINSISEGVVHEDLRLFLETNVPKSGKKQKVTLGVADSKIGSVIPEELGIKCSHIGVVPEVIRGIRAHFHNMVKGLTELSSGKAQLGLGHSYSRAKVKFNVNRADNMIIQSISLMDQLDKNINTFSMRIREWYSYHFPELVKIVNDNYLYAKVARFIGMDISPIDLLNIEAFASKVISLTEYRRSLHDYLHSKMGQVAPNLGTLIGDQVGEILKLCKVGARLIAHAGSLTNLAKYPASTVQILGAEKALFRALKTRGNTPKYGLIFHSTFIGRAGTKNKGRISRYLANKCSIASRIDCFAEYPTKVFGEHLKQQVEDRLKFYETGDAPKKNIDVMKEAVVEASEVQEKLAKKEKKKKKKDKKRKSEAMDSTLETSQELDTSQEDEPPKKKKKNKVIENGSLLDNSVDMESEEPVKKKKKKKKKNQDQEAEVSMETAEVSMEMEDVEDVPKKKKKKKKNKEMKEAE
ncbi:hypothetical protein FSP39_005296 [Pinctada imbricata]|uniref:Nucleolar protein 56 n=1 Tax=Pinctada imbricata TaxID=66713 RepID=A0AA88XZA5_PINIB|nr:hypothetical protein FSP39_005296 [Pinctada imbricata]